MNLCEIYHPVRMTEDVLTRFLDYLADTETFDRLYLGSSFCSQYFLHLTNCDAAFTYCKDRGIPVTLTIPVFTQRDLEDGKRRIDALLAAGGACIDEITVNDLGMLHYIREHQPAYRVNLGRLFSKDPRDCRVSDYKDKTVTPMLLTHLDDAYWQDMEINAIELDQTNAHLDLSNPSWLGIISCIHIPYCYMTTGNICEFASIHRPIQEKFRPNLRCSMECAHITETYPAHRDGSWHSPLQRFGRTLYFHVLPQLYSNDDETRLIYFPVVEWEVWSNEDSGSAQQG